MTRFGWVMTTCFAALSIGVSALFHPAPRLLWNASASVPIGLYAVHRAGGLHVGELLVVTPPEPLATFLDQRKIAFPNIYYTGNADDLAKHLRFNGELPITIVYDRNGKELWRHQGRLERDATIARLREISRRVQ